MDTTLAANLDPPADPRVFQVAARLPGLDASSDRHDRSVRVGPSKAS